MVLLIFGQPMKAVYNFFIQCKIRLGYMLSLIFFVLFFLTACKQNKKEEISIEWNNNQATGIVVPKNLLEEVDSISQLLQVRVENNKDAMLGSYSIEHDYVLFQPLVPLSRGLNYDILFRNKIIGKINVPRADAANAPKIVVVYPSADTLPENLLKLYFQFSAPMREGEALQHITLLDEQNDTLPNVFLNLQQELWNTERTVLTVWLDPGRIKRDLVPNQEMGNPLQQGKNYTLTVSNQWKDVQGLALQQDYKKVFFVSNRDEHSPQPQLWQVHLPKAGTREPLQVNYNESLDYFLLQETISIRNEQNNLVDGTIRILENETSIEFIPTKTWQAGRYQLRIASYLEDLAGNNLLRPFDRDIKQQEAGKELDFVEREFVITVDEFF